MCNPHPLPQSKQPSRAAQETATRERHCLKGEGAANECETPAAYPHLHNGTARHPALHGSTAKRSSIGRQDDTIDTGHGVMMPPNEQAGTPVADELRVAAARQPLPPITLRQQVKCMLRHGQQVGRLLRGMFTQECSSPVELLPPARDDCIDSENSPINVRTYADAGQRLPIFRGL